MAANEERIEGKERQQRQEARGKGEVRRMMQVKSKYKLVA
jgi:hypothetical protein